ncbi:MAG: LacI family DNA-binding transcriptional regulator [Phycisphaerales bacterium]
MPEIKANSMEAAPAQARRGRPPGAPSRANGKRRVSMREVAQQASVSVATVSMVLNDNPRISKATQVKVRRIIEKLGYRPNRLAQSLSSQYTRVLAVLLPPLRHAFSDPYFGELLSGICDRADRLGHKVMLESAKPDFLRERKHMELFERRFVDGMFCLGVNDRHPFVKDFAAAGFPMVCVNNYFPDLKLDYVVADYRSGAEQVMNVLLQLGHKKVALINGAPEAQTARDVLEVYSARMRDAGLTSDAGWTADGRFTEEGGAAATDEILSRHPDVTAIFAGNDKMALGAMHRLVETGRRVPGDVSVVGFDDIQQMAFVNPSLTTVHLPLYEVGARACDLLVQRVRGKTDRIAERLATHLVLRDSTAIVPGRG